MVNYGSLCASPFLGLPLYIREGKTPSSPPPQFLSGTSFPFSCSLYLHQQFASRAYHFPSLGAIYFLVSFIFIQRKPLLCGATSLNEVIVFFVLGGSGCVTRRFSGKALQFGAIFISFNCMHHNWKGITIFDGTPIWRAPLILEV